ncbi:MFS general substrate transporter [Rhizodiscina lignyota]|uniref:MFS general substrate transporter n=1 Tax=Rhizodiscina lignyota TaxID=1504668 RepID=A0A9P4IEV3_9PEZI|nr:MFS general substrate transporter [Rhizodiscina lignyota]
MASSETGIANEAPIELQFIDNPTWHTEQPRQEFSLPPADRGKAAWLFLMTCFFVECFIWGFPFSYGILQEYYSTHEPFVSKPSGVAAIGTTALRWPSHRRYNCFVGVAVVSLSLIASSFSQAVWQLILTQGVGYAVGAMLLYDPILLFLHEWFVQRKGLAFGVMWAGTGASGIFIPYFLAWGLDRYGFRTILRAWGVACFVFLAPMMLLVKPRIPLTLSSSETTMRRFDWRFVLTPAFIIFQIQNIFQGMGYFIPGIYLPSYAHSLGMSKSATTATIALLNSMGVFGCISAGLLIDRLHVATVQVVFALGSALSVFFLWGFSVSVPLLLVFSAAYGFFAFPYTTMYTGVMKEVRRQCPGAEFGLLMGLLSAGRGIGSVVSGPLSEALLKRMDAADDATTGYDSDYVNLIIFTGTCVALGGCFGFGAKRIGWL